MDDLSDILQAPDDWQAVDRLPNVMMPRIDGFEVLRALRSSVEWSEVPVLVLTNGGDAEVYGLEMEALWHPAHGLDISAGFNWMHTEVTKYNSIPGTGDNTGNNLANSPELSFNSRIGYQFPLGASGWQGLVSGDAIFRDDVFYSLGNNGQSSQDSFWLLNGRVGVISPDGLWEIALWGKNLTDEFYVTQSYDNLGGIFPSQNFLGMPRTYGVSVPYSF